MKSHFRTLDLRGRFSAVQKFKIMAFSAYIFMVLSTIIKYHTVQYSRSMKLRSLDARYAPERTLKRRRPFRGREKATARRCALGSGSVSLLPNTRHDDTDTRHLPQSRSPHARACLPVGSGPTDGRTPHGTTASTDPALPATPSMSSRDGTSPPPATSATRVSVCTPSRDGIGAPRKPLRGARP